MSYWWIIFWFHCGKWNVGSYDGHFLGFCTVNVWVNVSEKCTPSSCLYRTSTVSKHRFIIPTDAHNYKIIGMLKTIKIPTISPTCFGSHRNHHQGAISCLAKTTVMIILCSLLLTWSMLWRHTSCNKRVYLE